MKKCIVSDCEGKSFARGYCQAHNKRLKTHGSLELRGTTKLFKGSGENSFHYKRLERIA